MMASVLPSDPPWRERFSPPRQLVFGQHLATRPQTFLQRQRITFGQACLAHLHRRRGKIVLEGMVLDAQSTAARRDGAVPGARSSIIGRHADGARIVPK